MITSGPLTARSRLAAILLACACLVAPLGLIAQPAAAATTTGDVTVFPTTIEVVTDSNGDATAPFTANATPTAADGYFIVTADVAGAPNTGFTLTTSALPVMTILGGSPQTGLVGMPFGSLLQVHVEDGNGAVVGATVAFEAPSSDQSGTFAGHDNTVDVVTDSSGDATAPAFTANETSGAYHVTASLQGTTVSTTFEITNRELTITVVTGANQHAYTDDAFATQFVAHVVDHTGAPVVGVYVTFTPPSSGAGGLFHDAIGGGWIAASFAVATDNNGNATAPPYKANGTFSTMGAYSVLATVDGAVPPGANFPVTNDERPTITSTAGDTQSTPINHTFGTDLVAHLVKSTGPVVGATVTFTAPDSEPTGTFTGSVATADAVTDSNGDATAPTFTAGSDVGGPYAVTATAGGVVTPASFALTNDVAPDYQLLQISPHTTRADVAHAVAPALEVQIRDSFNAPVVGVTVTFAATSGPSGATGTFEGDNPSADVVTDGSGFATAPTFIANSTVGSYNVAATSTDSSQSVWFSVLNQPTASTMPISTFNTTTSDSAPITLTLGPDGNMWFAENSASKIGKITPAGVVTEYTAGLTPNGAPAGITLGPDGNLWFAEAAANKIGKITPGGVVTEYSIPTVGAAPFFIVAGPDGNLWFSERQGNNIGRITTTGDITEFSITTPNAVPFDIVSGPGGALWFTEAGVGRIGRITTGTHPVVTEFPLPSMTATPYGIAQGSDGNLWVTEANANNIARMTPSGAVTEFAVPTPNAIPVLPTLGADGNVWFTEQAGNRLGRVTPSGDITEFDVPTANAFPTGIASGPDGNVWFTQGAPAAIARATIPVSGVCGAKRYNGVWGTASLVAPSTSTSRTPVTTVDSTNRGHFVYAGADGLYYASRTAGSANWPAATKIPGTRTGDTQPSIVTRGTTVYVAFHRTAGTARGIYVSTKVGTAGAWSTTSRAVTSTTAAAPSIGVDATGTVHVAWQQSTGIGYSKRTGTTWSAAVVIAGSAAGSLTPSLVVNQAGTASVQVAFSRPGTGIRLATRAANGTWSSAVVTGTTSFDVTPSLAIDKANKLYIVTRRTGATAPGIYYFRNRTRVWVKQHVGGTVASDTSPSIAVNSFATTPLPQLAFTRPAGNTGVYTSAATTGNFATPTRTISGTTDTSPDIAVDSTGARAYLTYGT